MPELDASPKVGAVTIGFAAPFIELRQVELRNVETVKPLFRCRRSWGQRLYGYRPEFIWMFCDERKQGLSKVVRVRKELGIEFIQAFLALFSSCVDWLISRVTIVGKWGNHLKCRFNSDSEIKKVRATHRYRGLYMHDFQRYNFVTSFHNLGTDPKPRGNQHGATRNKRDPA